MARERRKGLADAGQGRDGSGCVAALSSLYRTRTGSGAAMSASYDHGWAAMADIRTDTQPILERR